MKSPTHPQDPVDVGAETVEDADCGLVVRLEESKEMPEADDGVGDVIVETGPGVTTAVLD